jgi:hypothetical protein
MDILSHVLDSYQSRMPALVGGMTMLFGNAKEGGLLVTHILESRLGDRILTAYL